MEWIGLGYVADAQHRLFWLYLLSSALIAGAFAWRYRAYRGELLDKKVWWHPSARLDYAYFPLISLIKVLAVAPLVVGANEVALATLRALQALSGYRPPLAWDRDVIAALFTLTLFVVSDFTRYWLHRALHTVPLLWRFHAVHHSAEVLNPLTFYRVHPVENLLFGLRYALGAGLVTGGFVYLFGARLGIVEIMGANALVFFSALAGSNLRHTHLPVRFGALERWIVSPFMHQIHHSADGMRRNYGGTLALWDRLFGTLDLRDTAPLRFGGGGAHRSLGALLFKPFTSRKGLYQ